MKIKKMIKKAVGMIYRYRYNKPSLKIQMAISRGVADTLDASNALQRNPDLIEELDHWSYYRSRKEYMINQILRSGWTIENCEELEDYIRDNWSSTFNEILYFLAEESFNGKVCIRLIPETFEIVWKHPIFITSQESEEDEDILEWFVLPSSVNADSEAKPITTGDYIFSRWHARDRNLMHGEGKIEACLSLKQDYDENRSNLRRYLRKMSVPIFKYFYDVMVLDSEKSTQENQNKIETLLDTLSDAETTVAIPLKMDDGTRLEEVEILDASGQVSQFIEEFNRIKLALEELLTFSDLTMGLNDSGSQAAKKEYADNTRVGVMSPKDKIASVINKQFLMWEWIRLGKPKTKDNKQPKFSWKATPEPEDKMQVEADILKFQNIIDSNTPIKRKNWYQLLHVDMPEEFDGEEIIYPADVVKKLGGEQSLDFSKILEGNSE